MMAKKVSFDKAFAELQSIMEKIQEEETGIDELSTQLKKAKDLVSFCKSKLREVEDDIASIDFDEED